MPSLPKSTINLLQVGSLDAMLLPGHQPTVTQFWADSNLRAPPPKTPLAPAGDIFPLGLLERRGSHGFQCSADTCMHQGQCTHCLCDTAISDKLKNLPGRRLINSLHYLSFLVFQVYEFFPLIHSPMQPLFYYLSITKMIQWKANFFSDKLKWPYKVIILTYILLSTS